MEARIILTRRSGDRKTIFIVPIGWMNVRRCDFGPIVGRLFKAIKLNQYSSVDYIANCSNANLARISPVIGFQFHADFEWVFVRNLQLHLNYSNNSKTYYKLHTYRCVNMFSIEARWMGGL